MSDSMSDNWENHGNLKHWKQEINQYSLLVPQLSMDPDFHDAIYKDKKLSVYVEKCYLRGDYGSSYRGKV
jgi:hypothetical protein